MHVLACTGTGTSIDRSHTSAPTTASTGDTNGDTTTVHGSCGPMTTLVQWDVAIPQAIAASDANATSYIAGIFTSTLNFGSSSDSPSLSNPCTGRGDSAYLTHVARDGTSLWARGAMGCGVGTAVLDTGGDRAVWVTYRRHTSVAFDGGSHPSFEFPEHGLKDLAVATYTLDGDLLWAADVGGEASKDATDVAVAADGAVYVVGTYSLYDVVFDPAGRAVILPYDPRNESGKFYDDGFLARWNPDGSLAWVVGLTGDGNQAPKGVTIVDDGTIVVSGTFAPTLEVVAGAPDPVVLTGDDLSVGFTAAFEPTGELRWIQRWGGLRNGAERIQGGGASFGRTAVFAGTVEEDPSFGTGWPDSTTDMRQGEFMGGWTSSGDVAFVRDINNNVSIVGFDADSSGRTAIGGSVRHATTFGQGLDRTSLFGGDPLVLTWAADGSELCTWPIRPSIPDLYDNVTAIGVDGEGGVWAAGYFKDALTFVPDTPEEVTITRTGSREWNMWVGRFSIDR